MDNSFVKDIVHVKKYIARFAQCMKVKICPFSTWFPLPDHTYLKNPAGFFKYVRSFIGHKTQKSYYSFWKSFPTGF